MFKVIANSCFSSLQTVFITSAACFLQHYVEASKEQLLLQLRTKEKELSTQYYTNKLFSLLGTVCEDGKATVDGKAVGGCIALAE